LWWIGQLKIVFEKTSNQEKIQENDKYQKCFYDQSHNPQSQHQKSQQDLEKKKQNTKSQTESVFEISEDLLNGYLMQRAWGSLKVHRHTVN
jgi:hypothetical protein